MMLSIITATYNSEKTLEETILSVQKQTFKDWEHIVIDGASTDNTLAILKKYPHVKWVSEPDKGVYDAMNKGVLKSEGKYLFFLGSDDILHSDTILEEIFDQENVTEDLIYGNVLFKGSKEIYSGESSIERLIGDQISICHQAIFYAKRVHDLIGYYNTRYFVHADYDFNVRCFENEAISKKYVNKIIAVFNETGISGTQSNKDGFHDDLTNHYLAHYFNPRESYAQNRSNRKLVTDLKREMNCMVNSSEYMIGKKVVFWMKKLEKILKIKLFNV